MFIPTSDNTNMTSENLKKGARYQFSHQHSYALAVRNCALLM